MHSPMDFSPASTSTAFSASSSSSGSSVHHASLVDPALHSPALLEMVDIEISRPVIDYTVDCVVETVDFAMGRPATRGRSSKRNEHTKFTTFVTNVLTRAEVTTPTLIGALAYIDRARPHLHIALEEWALERVFLGALIVASKYLNDSTLKNVHWALCTGVFGKRDVGRIEREFLDVLDFELGLAEQDLLNHHDGITAAVSRRTHPNHPEFAAQPHHHHFESRRPHHTSHKSTDSDSSIPTLVSSPHSSSSSSSSSSLESPCTPSPEPAPVSVPSSRPSKSSNPFDMLRHFPLPTHARPIRVNA